MVRGLLIALIVLATPLGTTSTAAAYPSPIAGTGGISASPDCYTATSGDCVESPDQNSSDATAMCRDGSYSHSETHSGTCSGHHGVSQWCPCGGDSAAPAAEVGPPPDTASMMNGVPSVPNYHDDLAKANITPSSPDGAVADGQQVCSAIRSGSGFADVEQEAINATTLDVSHAAHVIIAASLFLCPGADDHGIVDQAMALAEHH
jgi:hypothetical protein